MVKHADHLRVDVQAVGQQKGSVFQKLKNSIRGYFLIEGLALFQYYLTWRKLISHFPDMTMKKAQYSLNPLFQRVRFFAWFTYPLIFFVAVGFVGKEVAQRYNKPAGTNDSPSSAEAFIRPGEENARAELKRRFMENSCSFELEKQQLNIDDLFVKGWIMQNYDYRAFKAVNSSGTVALTFLSTMMDYRAELTKGAVVPMEGYDNPEEDPMAHAMTVLLDIFGNRSFYGCLKEAMNQANLESVFWQGRDCIALSFGCDADNKQVTLYLEQPDMRVYGRVDEYDSGLEIRFKFSEFKPFGETRQPRTFTVWVGNEDFYRVEFSSMRTTPI